jgi:hypothetical protein
MVNGLDVVAVWIQNVRSVIAGVIFPLSWSTVVSASSCQRCFVEGIYSASIIRLEGEMYGRRAFFGSIDPELISRKMRIALANPMSLAECLEGGAIESFACIEVTSTQMDMIDQSAAKEFHGFSHRDVVTFLYR